MKSQTEFVTLTGEPWSGNPENLIQLLTRVGCSETGPFVYQERDTRINVMKRSEWIEPKGSMKFPIELDNNDLKVILHEDIFPAFAKKHGLPLKDSFGYICFVSYPIQIDSSYDKFKSGVTMAQDSLKQHLRTSRVPNGAWLAAKEIWPGKIFLLLCAE